VEQRFARLTATKLVLISGRSDESLRLIVEKVAALLERARQLTSVIDAGLLHSMALREKRADTAKSTVRFREFMVVALKPGEKPLRNSGRGRPTME
jgi:hypothetical protein